MNAPHVDALRETVATACRILGHTGVAREITGHVSARVPGSPDVIVVRCRTEAEAGLLATPVEAARVVEVATGAVDDPSVAETPVELPIHTALLAARPDINAVVHVHPKHCLLCGLANIPLRPLYGAYEHHATVLVADGVPVLDDSRLIRDEAGGRALVAAIGTAGACLMRGHGITVLGASVEQATLRAVRLEHLAEITWSLHTAGVDTALPGDELAAFLGTTASPVLPKGERWAWNHYAARATAAAERLH